VDERREWRRVPAPDLTILNAIDKLRDAVQHGHVRSLLIVTVNPVHQHETAVVGDLTDSYLGALLGGLSRAEHELNRYGDEQSNSAKS